MTESDASHHVIALALVRTADARCAQLTGGHAVAVCGKPFHVHVHGWDAWARDGEGGRRVSVRVDSQYLDRSIVLCASTNDARAVAAAARAIIARDEIDEMWGEL